MLSPTETEQSLSRWSPGCADRRRFHNRRCLYPPASDLWPLFVGMASAQTRIADTFEVFYTDKTSEGALAANAYKRAVEDLDHSITRELARVPFLLQENVF